MLLIHYDLFDFFFQSVSALDSDSSKCQIFKVLQQYLSDQQNDLVMSEAAEINFTNLLNKHFETMVVLLYKYI